MHKCPRRLASIECSCCWRRHANWKWPSILLSTPLLTRYRRLHQTRFLSSKLTNRGVKVRNKNVILIKTLFHRFYVWNTQYTAGKQ